MPLTRAEQAARQAGAVGGHIGPSALGTSSNLPGLTADLTGTSADLGSMSDAVPLGLKDTQTVDDLILEIGFHIAEVEAAKANPDIPKNMVYDFSRQLKDIFNRGDVLLKDFETKNSQLVEKTEFLCLVLEDEPENLSKAELLRNAMIGEFSQYKGWFRRQRYENKHLLAC